MTSPIQLWDSLIAGVDAAAMCGRLSTQMRERRLRFGDRMICPFLRPFFLDAADETRVRGVAEMLWTLGERVAREAVARSEEHTSELQSRTVISYAVFCLKKIFF